MVAGLNQKLLLIGDVHATPEELGDCQNLLDLIEEKVKATAARPVFLGDQYNTHNIVRVEVMWFWREAFRRLKFWNPIAMVGNHDFAGEGLPIHAMIAHENAALVVDQPHRLDGVLLMPYFSNRDLFVRECVKNRDLKTMICHQTFDGAKYENGFYTQDGVDPDLLPQSLVLSGHIHTPQTFGKIVYIGAPRWRTLSDADVSRAIWLYEFSDDGEVMATEAFDTGRACRQIKYLLDTPAAPISVNLDQGIDWRIDVKGPPDWVEKRKLELASPGVRMRTFKLEASTPKVRESQGIDVAFKTYLDGYVPKFGTERKQLSDMAKDRLNV